MLKMSWIKILWKLSDDDLCDLQGTDVALYLNLIKYLAILSFLTMSLNLTVLVPIYATTKPGSQSISDFSVLSVVMEKPTSTRIWASFVFVVLNSGLGLACVYRYWNASMVLKHN